MPVTWANVEPVLAKMSPQLRAVVELMWHTGARPGEDLRIRMADIDRSGPVWTYKPASHKDRAPGLRAHDPAGAEGPGRAATLLEGGSSRLPHVSRLSRS